MALATACRPGLAAVHINWGPFLAIQIASAALVFAYFTYTPFHDAMRQLANAKVRGGLPFSLVAGCLAGGLVPELAKAVTRKLWRIDRNWAKQTLFNGFVYGIVAVQVDLFYQLQNYLFGPGRDPATLFIKTAVDMLIFAPLISIPTAVALFEWRSNRWSGVARLWRLDGYVQKVVPALVPAWAFWIPMLFCVYSMPPDLQFCLAVLAEAAWSILFVFIATKGHPQS